MLGRTVLQPLSNLMSRLVPNFCTVAKTVLVGATLGSGAYETYQEAKQGRYATATLTGFTSALAVYGAMKTSFCFVAGTQVLLLSNRIGSIALPGMPLTEPHGSDPGEQPSEWNHAALIGLGLSLAGSLWITGRLRRREEDEGDAVLQQRLWPTLENHEEPDEKQCPFGKGA